MSSVILSRTLGSRSGTLGDAACDGFAIAIAASFVDARARLSKTVSRRKPKNSQRERREENLLGKTTRSEIEYSRAPRLKKFSGAARCKTCGSEPSS
jgi:hypothetical protein